MTIASKLPFTMKLEYAHASCQAQHLTMRYEDWSLVAKKTVWRLLLTLDSYDWVVFLVCPKSDSQNKSSASASTLKDKCLFSLELRKHWKRPEMSKEWHLIWCVHSLGHKHFEKHVMLILRQSPSTLRWCSLVLHYSCSEFWRKVLHMGWRLGRRAN